MTLYANGKKVAPTNVAYEAPIEIPREIDSNGKMQKMSRSYTFTLPVEAKDLGSYILSEMFSNDTYITSANLSSLENISGNDAMYRTFAGCTSLTSVDLSNVQKISYNGLRGLSGTFYGCTSLVSIDLSSLSYVGYMAMQGAFSYTSLTSLSFPSLTYVSFSDGESAFSGMLTGVSNCTIHFPVNLQSTVGTWSETQNGFGGTSITVLFDLPATT